jgi:Putative ATPase subunit of terminase (gpP-like)
VRTIVYKARRREKNIDFQQILPPLKKYIMAGGEVAAFYRPRDYRDRLSSMGRALLIHELYWAGLTVRQIAEMCGLTERAIRKTVKKTW